MVEAEIKVSMLDDKAYSGLILQYGPGIITNVFDWAINCSIPLHPSSLLNTFNKFSLIQQMLIKFFLMARNCAKCWAFPFGEGKSYLPSHSESPM